MYGMNLLVPRPPSSPNKPPPCQAKPQQKGMPIPVNINLLITGNAIEGSGSVERHPKSGKSKQRPQSAVVDKKIMKTLKRSPSVDHSFYDKFERLDRDWVEGDKSFKEKGGRVKTDQKVHRIPTAPQKAKTACAKERNVTKHIPERFMDLAIAYDGTNVDNTFKTSKTKRIKSANTTRQARNTRSRKRRSASSHVSHERSISRKRSERSDSKSRASVASGSRCSSRTGFNRNRRVRGRKSRSRTRRDTPRYSNYGSTTRQNPTRNDILKQNFISTSVEKLNLDKRSNETSIPNDDKRIQSANLTNEAPGRKYSYVGTVRNRRILSANVVKLRVDLQQLKDDHSCVDAGLLRVSKERKISQSKVDTKLDSKSGIKNNSASTEKIVQTDPVHSFADETVRSKDETVHNRDETVRTKDETVRSKDEKRKISTEVPKLRMMVAPTALPTFLKTLSLRSLTRSSIKRTNHYY